MRKAITRFFVVAAAAVTISGISLAKDYQCRQRNGCVAHKVVNGVLKPVNFRKGDLVSTQDGWVVDTTRGWKKIKSTGSGTGPK